MIKTIKFDYILAENNLPIEILCLPGGSGILVIDKDTDDEIKLSSLSEYDREEINKLAKEWADYHIYMEKISKFIESSKHEID